MGQSSEQEGMDMNNILELKNVSKSFGGIHAVSDVSLSLEKGSVNSLIGPNGAGKTTIFNLITGIYTVDGGEILLDGVNIANKKQHIITAAGVARTFQNIRLFQGLNVLENVMTAYDPHSAYMLPSAMLGLPKKRRLDRKNREDSMHFLEITGIVDYAAENPNNLPYGLQRKLEIARALATNPKVLLLDEPAAGLNSAEIVDLIDLIRQLNETMGLSIILIEHRMQIVMELSQHIYVMHFGKMLTEGTPEQIQNDKAVRRAYIGVED